MYQFTEDCMTGIPLIDEEHQHLFELVNKANEELHSPADIRITGMKLLKELRAYAATHFAHEEAYMEKIADPELARQRKAHEAFAARMNAFDITRFDDAALRTALIDLLEYVSRWLFQHILGSDIFIGHFESPFAFTDKYLTGIKLIDDEHRQLFQIIAEANDLIHEEVLYDKYDQIMEIINRLKDYTEHHFSDEEAYMIQIHYPDLEKQRIAHHGFVDKLDEINLDEIDENQQEYLNNLISFLLSWLTMHILKMDQKIGTFASQIQK